MSLFRLIVQDPITEGLDYLIEEKDKGSPSNMWLTGVYMVAQEKNRNNREYELDEMTNEVARYNKDYISRNRSLGELEHPNSSTVNSERACHLITELRMDGHVARGKSKVLSTPMGTIVRNLVNDGVKLGMSSRALGQLEERNGVNHVKNMKLITVDCVADPSAPGAFVDGILESKGFIIKQDGRFEEVYDNFEMKLSKLPRKDIDSFLREQILAFINKLK